MKQDNDIIERHKCTGCQACRQICPRNAIEMKEDTEGYLYPVKNSNCTECGLCTKICPIINEVKFADKLEKQTILSAINKDKDIVLNSSSGGAFSSIVNAFCDSNYIIFGVRYGDNFKVIHDYINNKNELDIFRKSKYVQSNIRNAYVDVKNFLKQGKKVLFSGTPCQVAGLRNYLNKDYENLLCIDLICHGVPSQKVFDKYIEFIEGKYNSKIKNIVFRHKTNKNNKWNSKNLLIELYNGTTIIEDSQKNYYLKGFSEELYYRPSCKVCKYANPNRYSDITIADCWGIENVYSDIDVHKGQSLLIINSEKGQQLLDKINEYQETRKLTLDFAIKSNGQFREPTKFSKNRKKFFNDLEKRCRI